MASFGGFWRRADKKPKPYEVNEQLTDMYRELLVYSDPSTDNGWEDLKPQKIDVHIIKKMTEDSVIKSALNILKLSVLSRGFKITVKEDANQELADFIMENFDDMDGNIEDYLLQMLTCLEYGYSATEKVYERRKDSKKRDRIMLKRLKTLDPETMHIKTDAFGNTMWYNQRVGNRDIKIPKEKMIWWVHDKQFGDMHGRSELIACYKNWYIKDKILKFANVAYERYGTPLIIGRVEDKSDVPKMKQLLQKINGMTSLSISGEDSIEAIQNQQNVDWVAVLEYHTRQIYESMNIPSMLASSSKAIAGSYALSSNQLDIFTLKLQSLQRDIKSMLEEQVIKELIDMNFPNPDEYPKVIFSPLVDKDIKQLSDVIVAMITAGVVMPTEDWIREALGFDKANDDDRDKIERILEAEIEQKVALADYYTSGQNSGDPNGGQTKPTGGKVVKNTAGSATVTKAKGTSASKDERASVERERAVRLNEEVDYEDDPKL